MSIKTNFQRVLNRLEAQKADDRIPHTLNEEEGVEVINKKSGDTYFVKKFNPKTQRLAADAEKEEKKEELSPKEKEAIEKQKEKTAAQVLDPNNLDMVSWENESDKDKFSEGFSKLVNGEEVSKEELEVINKYAAIKDGAGENAIYFSNQEPGDFRQGARNKVFIKGGANAKKLLDNLADSGMNKADASSTKEKVKPKLTGKDATLGKLSGGRKKEHKIEKGETDKDGKVSYVKVAGKTLRRQPIPEKDELVSELNEMMKSGKMSKEEAEKKANATLNGLKRYNRVIDEYAKADSIETVELVEGADSATKEGREKLAKEGPKVIADGLRKMIKNPTEAEKKVLDRIDSLGNIEDPDEYEKEAMEILKQMGKTPSIKKGAPDVAEAFVMCSMNKRGVPCIAPAGETFKVADLIQLPEEDLDPSDPDYIQKLAQGGPVVVYMTDQTGNLSVKKDGGAASGLEAKLEGTTFKNEKTKEKLESILKMHNNCIATKSAGGELSKEKIEEGKKNNDEVEKWVEENEIDIEMPVTFPDGRSPKEWAEDTVKGWIEGGKGMKKILPDDMDEANKADLIAGLEEYARGGLLIEKIHNAELDYQDYHNANANTKSGKIEMANGIECLNDMSFSANPGFKAGKDKNGRWIVRPNSVYAGNLKKRC